MNVILRILCTGLVACLLLCSCGGGGLTAEETAREITAAWGGFPESGEGYYTSSAAPGERGYMEEEALYALYYGEKGGAGELDGIEDWCVVLAPSPGVRELHVFRARYKSGRFAAGLMLAAREKVLTRPELFASKSEFFGSRPRDVRVFVSGRYAVLCAGDDCSAVEEYFG